MRGSWLMLLAGAGCTQILGVKDITLSDGGSGSGSDAANLACITDPTITLFKPCFAALPTADVTVPTGSINTDQCSTGSVQAQGTGKPDVCVIAGKTLNVTSPIRAYGSRPLVLAAVTDVTVSAMIDVLGDETAPAAGSQPADCTGTTAGADDANSPSGGGGGAFGGASGGGGTGAGGALPGNGIGGIAKLMYIRGGCNGATGGNGSSGTAGAGGTAGGAVYLVAGNSVTVMASATIAAGGGGGKGGTRNAVAGAGGGGASGGLIAIEAPTLGINGVLYANGGGGGGGGGAMVGNTAGGDGQTGTLSTATGGSAGGSGAGVGGVGGVDAVPSSPGGAATTGQQGAGGGGGSIGIIWLNYMFADTSGSSISPAETGP